MTNIRLIVFDCDGTLVDSQHMIGAAMTEAFERAGLVAPELPQIRRMVGLSLTEAVSFLKPDADIALCCEIAEWYRRAFQDLRAGDHPPEPLYDGIPELLRSLDDAGYLLGVATGKSTRGLRKTLEIHDIGQHFVTLQTADHHPSKPNPAMLQTAISEAGATAANTVLIGDTTFDMMMARDAGAHALGVDWGYHEVDELLAAGALAIATAPDDVSHHVAKFIGQ